MWASVTLTLGNRVSLRRFHPTLAYEIIGKDTRVETFVKPLLEDVRVVKPTSEAPDTGGKS
jgi:hypothetical protein